MTRLRNNPANVVEQDTSDSDGSFSHSKHIDDDTRDDDDDEIEIMTPRNVSSEIPRSSVFRRVSTEVVPAPSSPDDYQRKVSGDKPRKVTFDSSPTSTKRRSWLPRAFSKARAGALCCHVAPDTHTGAQSGTASGLHFYYGRNPS